MFNQQKAVLIAAFIVHVLAAYLKLFGRKPKT